MPVNNYEHLENYQNSAVLEELIFEDGGTTPATGRDVSAGGASKVGGVATILDLGFGQEVSAAALPEYLVKLNIVNYTMPLDETALVEISFLDDPADDPDTIDPDKGLPNKVTMCVTLDDVGKEIGMIVKPTRRYMAVNYVTDGDTPVFFVGLGYAAALRAN